MPSLIPSLQQSQWFNVRPFKVNYLSANSTGHLNCIQSTQEPSEGLSINYPPAFIQPWLLDRGSLTQALIQESGGEFSVEPIQQGYQKATGSEKRLLQAEAMNKPCYKLFIREVLLLGGGKPWVYARTLIPPETLTGRLRVLKQLHNRSLGSLLFTDPKMQRGAIQTACIHKQDSWLADEYFQNQQTLYGRRSIFFLDNKPILVNEVFLPDFIKRLNSL